MFLTSIKSLYNEGSVISFRVKAGDHFFLKAKDKKTLKVHSDIMRQVNRVINVFKHTGGERCKGEMRNCLDNKMKTYVLFCEIKCSLDINKSSFSIILTVS